MNEKKEATEISASGGKAYAENIACQTNGAYVVLRPLLSLSMHTLQEQNILPGPMIYLVDDERSLLDLEGLSLAGSPWRVKKFTDPEEALRSFEAEDPKPVVLLTDYAMGMMNGLELAARCKQLYPALKVLLLSGTADPGIIVGAPVKVDGFLAKPFLPNELLGAVQSLLEQ